MDVRSPDAASIVDTAALTTAETVVWAGLSPDAAARHANPRMLEVTPDEVLADARAVLARMMHNAPPVPKTGVQAQRIIATTSCPTGIAHTFMAAEALTQAARDPFRVIPALVVGSACAGALSMLVGVELRGPHGGAFVLPIPNAATHLGGYVAALVAGTVVTAVPLAVMKRRVAEAPEMAPDVKEAVHIARLLCLKNA